MKRPISCGSEPAREEGVSANMDVIDLVLSRAGSLPQVNNQCGRNWLGATPLQRTKAWRKLAVSLKPRVSAMR